MKKYQLAKDGWISFSSAANERRTQQLNIPIQTTGAVMLRKALIKLVDAGVDVICSHHDAFYANCKVEDIEWTKKTMERCMQEASDETIGTFVKTIAKANAQLHGLWYRDDRGDEQLAIIAPLLGWTWEGDLQADTWIFWGCDGSSETGCLKKLQG